jgi:hypothetical protein
MREQEGRVKPTVSGTRGKELTPLVESARGLISRSPGQ